MSRKTARAASLQLAYEALYDGPGDDDTLLGLCEFPVDNQDDLDYIRSVQEGLKAHDEEIDRIIAGHLKGWTLDRLSRVTHASLRIGVYELLWCPDVPESVAIREAVELVQRFDEESEGHFVNGVLRSVLTDKHNGE